METRRGKGRRLEGHALLAIALCTVAVARAGTPVAWNGGAGSWSNPAAWSLNLAPNNSGTTYDVSIGNQTDDVSLDMSATVDTVANAGTLRLLAGRSLTLAQPGGLTNTGQLLVDHTGTSGLFGALNNSGFGWVRSGTLELSSSVQNSGTIWMGNGSSAGGTTVVRALNSFSLEGSGELYFFSNASVLANQPLLDIPVGRTVTNAAGHRIHGGSGRIDGAGEMINQGLIDADIPLRTLRLDVDNFSNQGNLWARSGNLAVTTADWHNSGVVRVSNGSRSTFSGTLFTNDAGGLVESVGGADLAISQNVTNFGVIGTGGSGVIRFGGASTVVSNLPGGTINANAGTVRFEASSGYLQNFGAIQADQGVVEFANGSDAFGGTLTLTNSSLATVKTGITTLTQLRTTLDASSTLSVIDEATGAATLTFDGILNNNGGTLATKSNTGNSATFNLGGHYTGAGGTLRSDGGDLNVANALFEQTGGLALDIRNGGDIRFTNVDSTASSMNVSWTGLGGSLVFDSYRTDAPTNLDLSGWSGTGGALTVTNGSMLTATGLATLPSASTLTLSNAGSSLSIPGMTNAAAGSLIDLVSGGTLTTAPTMTTDGNFSFRGGTLAGGLTLNSGAGFTVTSGTNTVTGDLAWVGNRNIIVTGASTNLTLNGAMNVAGGSSITLPAYSTNAGLRGTGTVTNAGLIEGTAQFANQTTFSDINLVNAPGGVVRARKFDTTATNTTFQLSRNITNDGLMEADAANMTFSASTVSNNAEMRAVNGGTLNFLNGATVAGGVRGASDSFSASGDTSRITVQSGALVNVSSMDLNAGGDLTIDGVGSRLNVATPVTVAGASVLAVNNSGTFAPSLLSLDGVLSFSGGSDAAPSTIVGPVALTAAGRINSSTGVLRLTNAVSTTSGSQINLSGAGTHLVVDGSLDVANGMTLSHTAYSTNAGILGNGTITNHGLISARPEVINQTGYLDADLINAADGVVRSSTFNAGTTNTTLELRSSTITNAGLMEADGRRMTFTTAAMSNTGTVRAINNGTLRFQSGSNVTGTGTLSVDGDNSFMDVLGGSNVTFGAFSMLNNSEGTISDVSSRLTAATHVTAGSTLTATSSGRLSGPSAQIDGTFNLINSASVDAPMVVSATGRLRNDSGTGTINAGVTVQNDGLGGLGRLSLLTNSARFNGTGLITNSGLIEGGAISSGNSTFLDNNIVNNADGTIRAFRNGAPTNTFFQLTGDISNAGMMEAVGANLYFTTGCDVTNSGTLRAVNNAAASKLIFLGGSTVANSGGTTQIDGALSALEISGASNVNLGNLSLTNNATGFLTDLNSVLTANTNIGAGSTFSLLSSGRLAGTAAVNGTLVVQSSGRVDATTTVHPTGRIRADSGTATLNGAVSVLNDGGGNFGRISIVQNSARVNGTGLITNSGIIEGGATSTGSSTFLDNNVVNNADGTIRAFRNGAPTNTFFQLAGDIANAGLMEADGANLYFTSGCDVTNSGTLRAKNNAVASKLIFLGGSTVANSGGSTQIDGALSALEVSGAANLNLGNLSFTNGSTGFVTDLNSVVTANTSIGAGSTLTLLSSGRLAGTAAVDGNLVLQSSARLDATTTVNPTGRITANSGTTTVNGNVNLLNDGGSNLGRISIVQNSARINGTGVITNSGLIEGGAPTNGNTTFLDNAVVNNADGTIRAFRNGAATGTFFQLTGPITNAGIMEADGGTLNFPSATNQITNSGTIRSRNSSQVLFNGGIRVNDAGGILRIMNTGTGVITDANTRVDASTIIEDGGTLTVTSSGRLGGPSLQVAGDLVLQNSVQVLAPTTVTPLGLVTVNSNPVTYNADITLQNDGGANLGTFSIVSNSATVSGTGVFHNSGLVQGGASTAGNSTFLSNNIVNQADGIVRAFRNGAATNTFFQLTGDVTNQGVMEAVGANLYFPTGSDVVNSGTLRAVNNAVASKLIWPGGSTVTDAGGSTVIDGALSALEVSGASTVALGNLSFSNNGTGFVSGSGSVVTANTTVGAGSTFSVTSSGRLAGPGALVNGNLVVQTSGVIATPVTVAPNGQLRADSSIATINANVTTQNTKAGRGRISLLANNAVMGGTGILTNSGMIEGGAPSAGNTTVLNNAIVNNADGIVRAFRNGAATGTTFQLGGSITNAGIMEADGGTLSFVTTPVTNSGTLRGVNTSQIRFGNGTVVTDAGGSLHLTSGGTGLITDAGTRVNAATTIDPGSTLTVTSSGRLGGPSAQVNGNLVLQNSVVVTAPTTVGTTGQITVNSQPATYNADILIQGDPLRADGRLSIVSNNGRLGGLGVITNHGVVEGGAATAGNTTFLDNEVVNASDGLIRAYANGGVANTTFQLSNDIVNQGSMQADAATLNFSGLTVDNAGGSWSAINGGRLLVSGSFVGGASGSNTTIDGDASRLELTGGSLVGFDTLNLTNGGDVTLSGTNTSLAILSPFTLPPSSVATVGSGSLLQAGGITANGILAGQGGNVTSNVHVGAGGRIEATSGNTTISGNITTKGGSLINVTNSGTTLTVNGTVNNVATSTVRLNSNTTALTGAGSFTNAGLVEGGAFSTNNTVTLTKPLTNSGQVNAVQIGAATGTTFQLTSPTVVNSGTMTASGAHLTFTGSSIDHSGLLRAENGRQLTVQSSGRINNLGGDVQVDGAASVFQVLSGANAAVDTLALTNGGDLTVQTSTLGVAQPWTAGAGSVVTVNSSAVLNGGAVRIENLMNAGPAVINTPVTLGPLGQIAIGSASAATFNAPVTIETNGANDGRLSLLGNSFWMNGTGLITNSGVIESSAATSNNSTFLYNNILNTTDGLIRAFKSGAGNNNTFLQLSGAITNNGLMEADGGNLYFTGASVLNSGTVRAVNHANGSRVIFLSAAQLNDAGAATAGLIDGALSTLEISGNADVVFDTLSFTNGAGGSVSGTGSTLAANTSLGAGSIFTVDGGAALGGAGLQVAGTLNTSSATISAPTSVTSTGRINVTSSTAPLFNSSVDVAAGGWISLLGNSYALGGSGTVTNNGLIEGGAATNGNSTFVTNAVVNNAGGVIRAVKNGAATNTFLQLSNSVTNVGTMEANGANLYLTTGAVVQNSGTISAVSNATGSKIIALNSAQVNTVGGLGGGQIDGTGSALEISGNADVAFSTLTLTNNATGFVNGAGSTLTTGMTVAAGSTFSIQASGQLTIAAGGLSSSGTVQTSGTAPVFVANGPVTTQTTGNLTFAAGTSATFNSTFTSHNVLDMGANNLDMNGVYANGANGRLRALAGGRIRLSDDFSNASTQAADFDSRDITWELDTANNALDPLLLEVGGREQGAVVAGLTNNFAMGTLFMSGADQFVTLVDAFNNAADAVADALYVSVLTISDLDSRLLLNGLNLYYQTFNGSLSQIDASLGGTFIQLPAGVIIPEPGTLLVLALGAAWVTRAGRRRCGK